MVWALSFSLQALLSTHLPAFLAAFLSPCFWASHPTGKVNIWQSSSPERSLLFHVRVPALGPVQAKPTAAPYRLVVFHLAIRAFHLYNSGCRHPVIEQITSFGWCWYRNINVSKYMCSFPTKFTIIHPPSIHASWLSHPSRASKGILPVVPERIVLFRGLGPRADDLTAINSIRTVIFRDVPCIYK